MFKSAYPRLAPPSPLITHVHVAPPPSLGNEDGLVLFYRFDQCGDTVSDVTGKQASATVQAGHFFAADGTTDACAPPKTTVEPGVCTEGVNALALDGSISHVLLPPLGPDGGGPLSTLVMEAWLKLDSDAAGQTVLAQGRMDQAGDFRFFINSNQDWALAVFGAGTQSFGGVGATGRWRYLVLELQPTNATLYLRGQALKTISLPGTAAGFYNTKQVA